MRICIEKSTGRIIEMQSAARAGTLRTNAIAAGYDTDGIEEREVTGAEYQALFAAQPDLRSYADKRRDEYNRRGVTYEAVMEALIENAGNRPEKLMALMAIRDEVRAAIPKS